MGKVLRMEDFRYPWKEVLTIDCDCSTLQVYVNERTGETEIVQLNDDGEAIRTTMNASDACLLASVLSRRKQAAL